MWDRESGSDESDSPEICTRGNRVGCCTAVYSCVQHSKVMTSAASEMHPLPSCPQKAATAGQPSARSTKKLTKSYHHVRCTRICSNTFEMRLERVVDLGKRSPRIIWSLQYQFGFGIAESDFPKFLANWRSLTEVALMQSPSSSFPKKSVFGVYVQILRSVVGFVLYFVPCRCRLKF
jgi:hypothetical protein